LLVENRGPEAFISPFDRAMLESQRAFFVRSHSLLFEDDSTRLIRLDNVDHTGREYW
jgi:hypothetical protein